MTININLLWLVIVLSGCSISVAEGRCRAWQREGLVVSSIDACMQCYDKFGSDDPKIIQGCAIGLDAASIFSE